LHIQQSNVHRPNVHAATTDTYPHLMLVEVSRGRPQPDQHSSMAAPEQPHAGACMEHASFTDSFAIVTSRAPPIHPAISSTITLKQSLRYLVLVPPGGSALTSGQCDRGCCCPAVLHAGKRKGGASRPFPWTNVHLTMGHADGTRWRVHFRQSNEHCGTAYHHCLCRWSRSPD
jgi:hypothetical protein